MGTINYGSNCTNEGIINIGLNLNRFRSPITIMRRANMMREIVEVRSEITYLNTMLQLLVNAGCVEYWPGWCTGYSTAAETRKAIIANVERLWTYYKETYQEDEGDD